MNQNNKNQSSYGAFVGLDKSDKKINVSLQRCGQSQIERSVIKGGPEAVHTWVAASVLGLLINKWRCVWSNPPAGSSTP